jgi:hypothetical protein
MRVAVRQFKSLAIGLKELEPFVKDGRHLRSGPPFKSIGLRSREAFANWLLCAVGNYESGTERLMFSSDPLGGDGIITDKETGANMLTEHVYVPSPMGKNVGAVEALIVKAVEHKRKKGMAYARGKTLIVLSDAVGRWSPNRAARRVGGAHQFEAVWVLHLERTVNGRYAYCVTHLDLTDGDAPVWKVEIAADFNRWVVKRNYGGLQLAPIPERGLIRLCSAEM